MAEQTRPTPHHFRGKPRPGRRIELLYERVEDMVRRGTEPHLAAITPDTKISPAAGPITSHTLNIGVGGCFIATDSPLPTGTVLNLTLQLPQGRNLLVRGEVRWVASKLDSQQGMGVKFYGLHIDDLLELDNYFQSLSSADSESQS